MDALQHFSVDQLGALQRGILIHFFRAALALRALQKHTELPILASGALVDDGGLGEAFNMRDGCCDWRRAELLRFHAIWHLNRAGNPCHAHSQAGSHIVCEFVAYVYTMLLETAKSLINGAAGED